jgi:hypothetical protein
MKTEILNTKWYWWIPILGLYFIGEMSGWVFDGTTELSRARRMTISTYIMLFIHPPFGIAITLSFLK